MIRTFAILLGLALPAGAEAAAPPTYELYFELKLVVRGHVGLRRVALDQWSGGKLRMQGVPVNGAFELRLLEVVENPWTFRSYPTKNEVKLGASVWVAAPKGHPYGQLAPDLIPLAREKHSQWWDNDRVPSTAPRRPSWSGKADRFWAEEHRDETRIPLHEDPVYPFHVLGPPAGRLVISTAGGGGVRTTDSFERMTTPWLANGWQRWIDGERPRGYGFWDTERPDWEPRTYPALIAGAGLLGWSAFADGSPENTTSHETGSTYDRFASTLTGGVIVEARNTITTLVPRLESKLRWYGAPMMRFEVLANDSEVLEVAGEYRDHTQRTDPLVRSDGFRYVAFDPVDQRIVQDEVQLLVERDARQRIRMWIKVGYRLESTEADR